MKKLFISSLLISILLIFPGCFGGGDEPTPDTETTTTAPPTERIAFYRPIEADDFTLQIPEDWETIQHFPSSYPENTAVAFINNNKDKDFIANINIVRNKVAEGTSSSDYALTMFQTISEQLVNFKKVTQTETQLPTGDTVTPSYLFEFEGTNNPTDRTRGFIQTFGVKGTTAYIVTGTYALSDDELAIDQIKQSVPSFRLK